MDLELLKNAIEQRERSALGYLNGDLAKNRADALNAYLCAPYGNEVEGRSQVITSDVSDVIEGVIPGLVRIFTSGEEIIEFEPFGADDEQAAQQETDSVNYYLTQQNNFLPFLQTWLRDGLISKVGYAKCLWEDEEWLDQETYTGLSEDELSLLASIPEFEIAEQEQTPEGWSIKLRKVNKRGKPKLYNLPPEEVLVDAAHNEVSLRNAKFVQHRPRMTISDIRKMGYDVPDDTPDDHEAEYGEEYQSRNRYEDEWWAEETNDPASRMVTFKETYIRIDMDGDGYTELRKVCQVGRLILANEEVDSIPICAWTPVIMPHKHVGRSLAEMSEDIQLTKTTILRQALDNLYLSNNGRWAISDQVNLDDMLVSRPGGVVRITDGGRPADGHIIPLVPPALAGQAFPMLEYMDATRETRTGITRYNQGLDANSLNKTATGMQAIMSAAQQRIELIARSFAEVGMRDLVLLMHELIRKHSDKETTIRLRGQWVPVDPRQWKTRFDMRINVGLGTGNREAKMAQLMQIMQIQREAFQIGVATPENVYNAASRLAEEAGFKSAGQFFSLPQPQQPQPDPKVQIEQAKLQIEQQKTQMQMQADQAKVQMDMQASQAKAQADAQLAQQKLVQDAELAKQKMLIEMELQREKMLAEIQIEREKMLAEFELRRNFGFDKSQPFAGAM